MSEQLYFFKRDRNKVESVLVPLLKEKGSMSFENHINNSEAFTRIVDNIHHDMLKVEMDDFFDIWSWFFKKAEQQFPDTENYSQISNKVEEDLARCGLIYFDEIPSTTPVRTFHEVLWEYVGMTQLDIDFICSKKELLDFINYSICYSGELNLFLNKSVYKLDDDDPENAEITSLISEIKEENNQLHRLALENLEGGMEYFSETIELTKKLRQFERDTAHLKTRTYVGELGEILKRERGMSNQANLLHYSVRLKSGLTGYEDLVIRLHSY